MMRRQLYCIQALNEDIMIMHSIIIIITISSADSNTKKDMDKMKLVETDDESQNQSIFQLIFCTALSLNVNCLRATESVATVCKFKHSASDNLIFNKVRHGVCQA